VSRYARGYWAALFKRVRAGEDVIVRARIGTARSVRCQHISRGELAAGVVFIRPAVKRFGHVVVTPRRWNGADIARLRRHGDRVQANVPKQQARELAHKHAPWVADDWLITRGVPGGTLLMVRRPPAPPPPPPPSLIQRIRNLEVGQDFSVSLRRHGNSTPSLVTRVRREYPQRVYRTQTNGRAGLINIARDA
jgi:hypothetical protein